MEQQGVEGKMPYVYAKSMEKMSQTVAMDKLDSYVWNM